MASPGSYGSSYGSSLGPGSFGGQPTRPQQPSVETIIDRSWQFDLGQHKNKCREDAADFLEQSLRALAKSREPGERDGAARQAAIERLQSLLRDPQLFPPPSHVQLVPYGSFLSSCYSRSSDLDLALTGEVAEVVIGRQEGFAPGPAVPLERLTREECVTLLWRLANALEGRRLTQGSVDRKPLDARVPIIKFEEAASGIECDVCVTTRGCDFKASVMRLLHGLQPSLGLLVQLVKVWAKQHDINSAHCSTLNSWSLALMVMFSLQVYPGGHLLPPLWRVFHDEEPAGAGGVGRPLQDKSLPLEVMLAVAEARCVEEGERLVAPQWVRSGPPALLEQLLWFLSCFNTIMCQWRDNAAQRNWRVSTWRGRGYTSRFPKAYVAAVEEPFDSNDNTARSLGVKERHESTLPYIAWVFSHSVHLLRNVSSVEDAARALAWLFGPEALPCIGLQRLKVPVTGLPEPALRRLEGLAGSEPDREAEQEDAASAEVVEFRKRQAIRALIDATKVGSPIMTLEEWRMHQSSNRGRPPHAWHPLAPLVPPPPPMARAPANFQPLLPTAMEEQQRQSPHLIAAAAVAAAAAAARSTIYPPTPPQPNQLPQLTPAELERVLAGGMDALQPFAQQLGLPVQTVIANLVAAQQQQQQNQHQQPQPQPLLPPQQSLLPQQQSGQPSHQQQHQHQQGLGPPPGFPARTSAGGGFGAAAAAGAAPAGSHGSFALPPFFPPFFPGGAFGAQALAQQQQQPTQTHQQSQQHQPTQQQQQQQQQEQLTTGGPAGGGISPGKALLAALQARGSRENALSVGARAQAAAAAAMEKVGLGPTQGGGGGHGAAAALALAPPGLGARPSLFSDDQTRPSSVFSLYSGLQQQAHEQQQQQQQQAPGAYPSTSTSSSLPFSLSLSLAQSQSTPSQLLSEQHQQHPHPPRQQQQLLQQQPQQQLQQQQQQQQSDVEELMRLLRVAPAGDSAGPHATTQPPQPPQPPVGTAPAVYPPGLLYPPGLPYPRPPAPGLGGHAPNGSLQGPPYHPATATAVQAPSHIASATHIQGQQQQQQHQQQQLQQQQLRLVSERAPAPAAYNPAAYGQLPPTPPHGLAVQQTPPLQTQEKPRTNSYDPMHIAYLHGVGVDGPSSIAAAATANGAVLSSGFGGAPLFCSAVGTLGNGGANGIAGSVGGNANGTDANGYANTNGGPGFGSAARPAFGASRPAPPPGF